MTAAEKLWFAGFVVGVFLVTVGLVLSGVHYVQEFRAWREARR